MEPSPRRWLMLLFYAGISSMNGLVWCTLTPITEKAQEYYGVSANLINLFEESYFIMYLPFAPFASWALGRNYYWCMNIGWIITCIGCWLRYVAGSNFALALIGQFLVASLNSMVLPGCSTLAAKWFPPKEQLLATTIGSLSNFVGIGCGFVIPPYVNNVPILMFAEALYASFFLICNVICSKKENVNLEQNFENFQESCKEALKDKKMLGIVLCSSSGVAVSYTVLGIMGQLLASTGMRSVEVGWIGFSLVMTGMFGGLIATCLVEKFKAILKPLRVFLVLSIFSMIFWAAIIGTLLLAVIGSVFVGFSLVGFVPLGIRCAVEQNLRIEESIPTNMIFFMAQILSLIYTYPVQYFSTFTHYTGLWVAAFLVLLSFGIFLWISRTKPPKACQWELLNEKEKSDPIK